MPSIWQKTMDFLGLVDKDWDEPGDHAGNRGADRNQLRPLEPTEVSGVRQDSDSQTTHRRPGVIGTRVEPPTGLGQRLSNIPEHAEAGVRVARVGDDRLQADSPTSDIINARAFTDAQRLADKVRSGHAVVMDLRNTEPAMVRRLVDFASGLTYALGGKMAKIGQGVILVTPQGVTISAAERGRLADRGLYMARQ